MPIQVIRPGAQSGFRPRRRLRARRGGDTSDLLAQALFQGFDSVDRNRDRSFQLELLGEQLSNQLELQSQGQQGTLDLFAAQSEAERNESAEDRTLARETNASNAAAQLAVIKEGNAGNLAAIKEGLGPQFAAIENQGRQIDQQGRAIDTQNLALLSSLQGQNRTEQRENIGLQRDILENEAQAAEGAAVAGGQREAALAAQSPITFSRNVSETIPNRSRLLPEALRTVRPSEFDGLVSILNELSGKIDIPSAGALQRETAVDQASALREELRGRVPFLAGFGIGESNEQPFLDQLDKLLNPDKVARIRKGADEFRATPEATIRSQARAPFDEDIRTNAKRGLELGTSGGQGLEAAIQSLQQSIGGRNTNPEVNTPVTPTPPDQQTTEEVILGPTPPGDQVGAASPLIEEIARKIARRNLLQQGLIA